MRFARPLLPVLLLLLALAPADALAQERATVLVFHGGGFLAGNTGLTEPLAERFRERGFRVENVAYPLGDVEAGQRTARRAARRARSKSGPVFAVGESVGGTFAAHLASARLVDGAVMAAAPTDLLRWNPEVPGFPDYWGELRLTPDARWRLSPYRTAGRSVPTLVFHSRADTAVPYVQSVRYARRTGGSLRRLRGDHLQDPSWKRVAVRWVVRRAGTGPASLPRP